jgi:hypothetical protein
VEGLLSAVILNIVVGLFTSLIGAGPVWAWGRARVVAIQQVSATWLFVANDDLVGGVCAPVLDGGG